MSTIPQKKLPATLHLKDMHPDVIDERIISNETPWVEELVRELEEDNDGETGPKPSFVKLDLKITLRDTKFYGEYVVVKSKINAEYYAPCIRCLALTHQVIDTEVNGLFLHESYATKPEYQEISSYFIENEEMELYYQNKGQVELKEFIHEQIYIERDGFPKCEGECVNKVLF